jgi:hypothetical protein
VRTLGTAEVSGRAVCMAAPVLALATAVAPAVAHADPVNDYVSRNGKAVCAALDKVQTSGDIFRLDLTIARDAGFSVKDAATVIGQSAVADCPWNASKVTQDG